MWEDQHVLPPTHNSKCTFSHSHSVQLTKIRLRECISSDSLCKSHWFAQRERLLLHLSLSHICTFPSSALCPVTIRSTLQPLLEPISISPSIHVTPTQNFEMHQVPFWLLFILWGSCKCSTSPSPWRKRLNQNPLGVILA